MNEDLGEGAWERAQAEKVEFVHCGQARSPAAQQQAHSHFFEAKAEVVSYQRTLEEVELEQRVC